MLHQHDLSEEAARGFVATVGVRKRDTVLEIGAGTGSLTEALLETGASVTAIEIDEKRARSLRERFAEPLRNGKLRLSVGDALRLETKMPKRWRIVANPPFARSAALLRKWLLKDRLNTLPEKIDLVLQFQTAKKWTPNPGAMTRTSALLALMGSGRVSKRFSRDDVSPPSHVPLSGWSFAREASNIARDDLRAADAAHALGFSGNRSMRDALRRVLTPRQIRRQAREGGWSEKDPPRNLRPEAWLRLGRFLQTNDQP